MRSKIITSLAGVVFAYGAALAADYNMNSSSSDNQLLLMQNTGSTTKDLITAHGIWDGFGVGLSLAGTGQGASIYANSAWNALGIGMYVGSDYDARGINAIVYNSQDNGYAEGGKFFASTGNSAYTYGVWGEASSGENSYNVGVYGDAYGGTGSTNYAGYFNGEVALVSINWISDRQFKKDIKDVSGGLDKIMALKPRSYSHKTEEYKGRMSLPGGKHLGFIAQELEEVLPELVQDQVAPVKYTEEEKKNKVKKEGLKYKAVDYVGVVPVLVAAVQEQQALIETMRAEIAALKAGK